MNHQDVAIIVCVALIIVMYLVLLIVKSWQYIVFDRKIRKVFQQNKLKGEQHG